jgi:hypothetical protein
MSYKVILPAAAALLTMASMNAYAVHIPVLDMADICTRYYQGDPAAIANYETLKDGKAGIDPVKSCADFKASGALDAPKPEATARSFMAQIAGVSPDRVRVEVQSESSQSAVATASASGKTCTFSLAPAPAGVKGGWLVSALDCKRSGGGGIPVTDYNAIDKAKRAASE